MLRPTPNLGKRAQPIPGLTFLMNDVGYLPPPCTVGDDVADVNGALFVGIEPNHTVDLGVAAFERFQLWTLER